MLRIVVFFFFLRCLSSATYVLYSLYCFHHPVGGNQFGNLTKCPMPSSSWQSSLSRYYQIKNPTRSIVIFSDTRSPLLTKNIPTGSSAFEIPLGTRHSVQTRTVISTSCGCLLGKISGLIILVLLMAHDLLVITIFQKEAFFCRCILSHNTITDRQITLSISTLPAVAHFLLNFVHVLF